METIMRERIGYDEDGNGLYLPLDKAAQLKTKRLPRTTAALRALIVALYAAWKDALHVQAEIRRSVDDWREKWTAAHAEATQLAAQNRGLIQNLDTLSRRLVLVTAEGAARIDALKEQLAAPTAIEKLRSDAFELRKAVVKNLQEAQTLGTTGQRRAMGCARLAREAADALDQAAERMFQVLQAAEVPDDVVRHDCDGRF